MSTDTMPDPSSTLTGRTALITGGGRGLGRAFARALAAEGARVAVLARSAHEVEQVAAELTADGAQALAVTADVADPAALGRAHDTVRDQLGEVDVLVNNAGVVWPLGRFAELDPDAWAHALAINLTGAFRLTRLLLPSMIERGWGRVVGVSSGAATGAGMPTANAYSVGKAGLDMLMRNVADELDGTGVAVANLVPGPVDTGMQGEIRSTDRSSVDPKLHDRFITLHAEGRLSGTDRPTALLVAMLRAGTHGAVLDPRQGAGAALIGD